MGLFTLIACSEDVYQDADKESGKGTVNNGSGGDKMPMTFSPNYSSPFLYGTSANYGTQMTYKNTTPFTVILTAFAGPINKQSQEGGVQFYPGFGTAFPDVTAVPSKIFTLNSGQVFTNIGCGTVLHCTTNGSCVSSPQIYDFGSFNSTVVSENSKIHYFQYEILDREGRPFASGLIKQRFLDDNDDYVIVESNEPGWLFYSKFDPLYSAFGSVVMFHEETGEFCLSHEPGTTNILPSSVSVSDPYSSTTYNLSFYTTASEVVLEFL